MNRLARGFTLIEMIVVVAIIVALAGVLVPIVTNELDDAKKSSAQATVNRLATALTQYMKDTGFAPTGKNGLKEFHFLASKGDLPTQNDFAEGAVRSTDDFLTNDTFSVRNWRGPYLAETPSDPWGSAYLVNVNGFFNGKERVWVISAGPNRTLETGAKSTTLGGDDIGLFID